MKEMDTQDSSSLDSTPLYNHDTQEDTVFYKRKCFIKGIALLNMLIVWFTAITCITLGIWLCFERDKVPELAKKFYNPAGMLIFNGWSYFVLFIFGLIGLTNDRKVVLVIYIFLLVVMITLQIFTGYLSFAYTQKEIEIAKLKVFLGKRYETVKIHLRIIGWMTYTCAIPMVISIWSTYGLVQKLDTKVKMVKKVSTQ